MAFDIYDVVFYDILKYGHSSSVLNGDPQHDLIFGLLIPSIFIILVVWYGMGEIFGGAHSSLKYLSSIAALGVILNFGWVPTIASIGSFIFVGLLAVFFFIVFYRRIFSHGEEKMLVDGARWVGNKMDLGETILSKKDYRKLARELRLCNHEYNDACELLENINNGTVNSGPSVVVGNTDGSNANNQQKRTIETKRFCLETAEDIVSRVPNRKRIEFITDNANDDKYGFQKELLILFRNK